MNIDGLINGRMRFRIVQCGAGEKGARWNQYHNEGPLKSVKLENLQEA